MASDTGTQRRPYRWLLWLPWNRSEESYRVTKQNENQWEAVCKAYRDRGLSDDDALLNARLAKILRAKTMTMTVINLFFGILKHVKRLFPHPLVAELAE